MKKSKLTRQRKKISKDKNYFGILKSGEYYRDDPKYAQKLVSQHRLRGFDDSETWGLADVVIRFTLPRLKVFRKKVCAWNPYGEFKTFEDYIAAIDKVIAAFELHLLTLKDDYEKPIDKMVEDGKIVQEGCALFGKILPDLAW